MGRKREQPRNIWETVYEAVLMQGKVGSWRMACKITLSNEYLIA